MKAFWSAVTAVCLVAAAVALWQQRLNATFVIATIGVLSWFLRYRGDLKRSIAESEPPGARRPEREYEEDDEAEDA